MKSTPRSVDKGKFRNDAEFEYLATLVTERAIEIRATVVYKYFLRIVVIKCLYNLPKNISVYAASMKIMVDLFFW